MKEANDSLHGSIKPFQEFVLDYFEYKYGGMENIVLNVMHDYLKALYTYEGSRDEIDLFIRLFLDVEDDSAWRVVRFLEEHLRDSGRAMETGQDFRDLINDLYPDDDLKEQTEILIQDYMQFCENQVSAETVIQYYNKLLIKKIEPRYQKMRRLLRNHDLFYRNYLSFDELEEVMIPLVPTVQTDMHNQMRSMYKCAEASMTDGLNKVSIDRLAMIGLFITMSVNIIPKATEESQNNVGSTIVAKSLAKKLKNAVKRQQGGPSQRPIVEQDFALSSSNIDLEELDNLEKDHEQQLDLLRSTEELTRHLHELANVTQGKERKEGNGKSEQGQHGGNDDDDGPQVIDVNDWPVFRPQEEHDENEGA
eukprot:TRINITY_DN9814_c0_g1_i1.p1 TRINITY_DN9814_c0_g1~~TRINITY_DN9814_c0_g1_i1.p1  ORF type:complete len:364 (+),score=145.07 TRINITY_DN9814_c0_g1_i1:3-1094(+)